MLKILLLNTRVFHMLDIEIAYLHRVYYYLGKFLTNFSDSLLWIG